VTDDYLGLRGKTAIVTGAGAQTTGIGNGRASAALLAEAGARVTLVDAVADRLIETEELVKARGGECLCIAADVTDVDDCQRIVSETMHRWGTVDVLVNNVGIIGPAASVVDLDPAEWDRCFRVNVTSVMLMSRFAIPCMESQGSGSIINVSSIAGVMSHPRPAYAASKGAVISLTKSMAMLHGPAGIRVNAIAPGMVYTPNVQVEGMDDAAREARAHGVPLQVEGTGWDVGNAVVYLAGSAARWVSGVCLNVDGGFSADLRISDAMSVTNRPRQAKVRG